jgi:deoxyribonuclease V
VTRPSWPTGPAALEAEQWSLAAARPEPWTPPTRPLRAAAAFVAFRRGEHGPGHAGDRAWVGAVLLDGPTLVWSGVVEGVAGAAYVPGLLALREGPMLADALAPVADRADVLLLDATGRDHPRAAGLALHVGAVLGRPSVGVTHRPLRARGTEPGPAAGDTTPLLLGEVEVGRWVRTVAGARPVVAHAGWRTDAATATAVVLACTDGSRTPEPLRQARRVARETRSVVEGRRR